ncbi:MAG: stage III sporulation protein AE [Clostridia bacterium]|nr:stage III sporulation protein AE [Clostridia bacterium]
MKIKKSFILLTVCLIVAACCGTYHKKACADELSDTVQDEIDNLDLHGLDDFFDGVSIDDYDFLSTFRNLASGKYDGADNFFDYIKKILFSEITDLLPTFISVIAIALLYEIVQNFKSGYLSSSVNTVIKFASVLTVILLLSPSFISIWQKTQILIENIGKLSEIMSPIILTLMVASGGTASAAVYKPSVVFFTGAVVNLFYSLVLPLIGILTVFNIASHFSKEIKLKRFSDFFGGILKWIFGIVIAVYGLFITVQGITVSASDGISAKIAKYAVSNSVPIVGGLIKEGLDVVSAGSIIIKNALGLAGLIGIFYFLLSPVIHMIVFSLLLKLAAAVCDVFNGDTVPEFLSTLSKSINYLIASVLTVGLMAFLTIMLMIFSANSVI